MKIENIIFCLLAILGTIFSGCASSTKDLHKIVKVDEPKLSNRGPSSKELNMKDSLSETRLLEDNFKNMKPLDILEYLNISTWSPEVNHECEKKYIDVIDPYGEEDWDENDSSTCLWSKTREDAIEPSKVRASDSGYDLHLLEKIKTVGDVEFYDTGIRIKPNFGYYFTLVPRSSISKTGYMLANSIGIIDRTYLGNIIVALRKIDKNAEDLVLPSRLVQIIPNHIVHLQFKQVDDIDISGTERGDGGFGSSNKK